MQIKAAGGIYLHLHAGFAEHGNVYIHILAAFGDMPRGDLVAVLVGEDDILANAKIFGFIFGNLHIRYGRNNIVQFAFRARDGYAFGFFGVISHLGVFRYVP
ncbi:hypothetical protein SDC9_116911 [bioreactor metagenome]|uniref:Uncharacterized protein n=1 Tax=bioreactor metagenome TaxID=1076179 RepID=A0A645C3P6_9ZZZZ